jgi:hypothetical protein
MDGAQASGAAALNLVASPLFYAHRHLGGSGLDGCHDEGDG